MSSLSSITSHVFDSVLALVYPQPCAVCGRSVESRHDGVACSQCWDTTRLFQESDTLCWKCGRLSQVKAPTANRNTIRCGDCDEDAFTVARACGSYEGALRAAILELKRQPHVARRLALLMCELLQREPLNTADVIVAVPLHPDRECERGFNQALVLARELSRLTGLPIDEHSVIRRLHTGRHRAGMDAKARRKSVADAFAVSHGDLIVGKRVLLVDDVFTTGATVSACALAVNQAGANAVFVFTIARV